MTPFGAKLRDMRRKRGITLKEMATTLQVSSAYLSALEHGKRGRPTWFMVQRIITFFNVIWDEAEELQRLAEVSDPRITVDTAGLEPEATELANLLAAKVGGLSKESLNHLIHQLRVVASKDGV
ncbi:helix-turn-helix transcriptional regulator [Breoghania sp.]|uniref:helix-turn-helix domain-containing protein n=1 Tax=Breoghania sp. TaxID=2065378 RepID=UPI002AA77727|nr:helix-turn-helix transcriptional regulator [Breoghania sp.]